MMHIITTILPFLLKVVLPLISAWFAAKGHSTLAATPGATDQQIQQLYAAWAAIGTGAFSSGAAIDWWKRRVASRTIDWRTIVSGASANGSMGIIKLVALIARVFKLVAQDPEATKLFHEAFGVPVTSMPQDANAIAQLAIVRTINVA